MEQENKRRLHLSKSFAVNRERLYRAWTEPGKVKQWWKPMNKQMTDVQNDIREGGRVIYRFGDGLQVSGIYKEALPGEKLVYSWNWELPEASLHRGEYLLTVSFDGNANESTLTVIQENFTHEQAVKPHEQGWDEALEDLRNFLENDKA